MSNDTQEMTLTEFLLARIAEDEADAMPTVHEGRVASINGGKWSNGRYYITRSPARVLAECEAKRQIVSRAMLLLDSWTAIESGHPEEAPYPDACRRERSFWRAAIADMAEVYADHPGYRAGWRP